MPFPEGEGWVRGNKIKRNAFYFGPPPFILAVSHWETVFFFTLDSYKLS